MSTRPKSTGNWLGDLIAMTVGMVLSAFVVGLFAVGLSLAAYLAWFNSETQQTKRALLGAPGETIADAPEGKPAKLVGSLEYEGAPLRAPLTGRPCACYHVVVEEHMGQGGTHEIINTRDIQPFFLRDATGTARVECQFTTLLIQKDGNFRSGTFNDASPELEAFLEQHGQKSTSLGLNRSLRYREGVLEEGEQVAVLGKVRREADPASETGGYRQRPERVVVGPADDSLYISDDPNIVPTAGKRS
jgi:hypothetical protein